MRRSSEVKLGKFGARVERPIEVPLEVSIEKNNGQVMKKYKAKAM